MSQILPISMAIFTILLIGVYYPAFISHSSQQGEEEPQLYICYPTQENREDTQSIEEVVRS